MKSLMGYVQYQSFDTSDIVGSIYTQEQLKYLKQQIQVQSGAKISKMSFKKQSSNMETYQMIKDVEQIHFVCQNSANSKCLFLYQFIKISSDGLPSLYELVRCNQQHTKYCYFDDEQKAIHKNKLILNRCRGWIKNLLERHIYELDKFSPKVVLNILASQLNVKQDYFYEGIKKLPNKNKIKKKFDNIIMEIKKKIKEERFSDKSFKSENTIEFQQVKELYAFNQASKNIFEQQLGIYGMQNNAQFQCLF